MPSAVSLTVGTASSITYTDAEGNTWPGFAHKSNGDGTYNLTCCRDGGWFQVIGASPGASALAPCTGGTIQDI